MKRLTMKRLFYLIAVMLYMGLVSCGKDGSIGPQGPMGEKGEQGVAGKDGATVLNGNTDPTAEQGSVGDFYIHVDFNNYEQVKQHFNLKN